MNGQLYQSCRIAAAAKKALKEQTSLVFEPFSYENKTEFQFLPHDGLSAGKPYTAPNPSEWFDCCIKKGLQDIVLTVPVTVSERSVLGFSNTDESTLLCFYERHAAYFTAHWTFDSEHSVWNTLYTEYEWIYVPAAKPRFKDESESFLKVLEKIKEFAVRIDCGEFAGIFQKAADLIKGVSGFDTAEYELQLPAVPERNLRIFKAAGTADVFGAMGSWNDEPPFSAYKKGLGAEYDELSDELLKQIRSAVLYSVNEW